MKRKVIFFTLILAAFVLVYFFTQKPHFKLDKIEILISKSHFEKLQNLRDKAIKKGVLKRSEGDFVSCKIVKNGKVVEGDIRLKGDWVDHLKSDKWSFRIKLEHPFENGIKAFSVQSPKSRDFLNGYVFHRLLRHKNVLSNEMTFVELIVNGESWGIYNFEEHLSVRMLSSQNRPEGVILNFEDDIFFDAVMNDEQLIGLIKAAKIKVRGTKKLKKNNKQLVSYAKKVMRNYQFQSDSLYKDFNSDAMAKYYAVCDLARAYHAMGWINIRFFFNFTTKLMEPIGYDGYPEMDWGLPYLGHQANLAIKTKNKYDQVKVVYSALYDSVIGQKYDYVLSQIIKDDFIKDFMEREKNQIDFFEKEIQKEFTSYSYNRHFLFDNAKSIQKALSNEVVN